MPKPARKLSLRLNWKKYERKTSVRLRCPHRHGSQIALGLSALFFLIALILVGKLSGFLGSISQPYSGDSPKISTWDGDSPLNLVVKMDGVYLLSYQPNGKSLTVFKFPGEIYMDTPYNFGKWPIRSIYDLGQAEKPPMGAKLLKDSIGSVFNLAVDGYIITDGSSTNFPNLIDRERGSLLPGIDLLSKTQTDLNIPEFLRVWLSIKGVRTDKLKIVDLEKSDLTKWLLLPDGSRVITLDQMKLDQFEEGRFENANIKDEGLSIGIFNATDDSGLAEKAAKIITNMGGRVIFTSNAPEKAIRSTILAKKSYTLRYLSKMMHLYCPQPKDTGFWQKISIFGLNEQGVCISDNNSFDAYQSDITIILGEDSFLRYKK